MADEKGARSFLAELGHESFKTMAEVSFWLDATRTAEDIKPQRIYEIIDLLDTAARPHQRKLAMEYLAGGNRLQKFKEQRIWSAIVEFSGQLAAAYEFCLAQAVPGVSGSGPLKPMSRRRAPVRSRSNRSGR
jgi:hypothetical protein